MDILLRFCLYVSLFRNTYPAPVTESSRIEMIIADSEQSGNEENIEFETSTAEKDILRTTSGNLSELLSVTPVAFNNDVSVKITEPVITLNDDGYNSNGKSDRTVKMKCEEIPSDSLYRRLGPAFNARYMSMDKPVDDSEITKWDTNSKTMNDQQVRHRKRNRHNRFFVESNFHRILPEEKYISLENDDQRLNVTTGQRKFIDRVKRASKKRKTSRKSKDNALPWQCESRVIWQDLGNDYFPRFLRSVECGKDRCWFNHFQCRAKAFTVKVLRRTSDTCVPIPTTDGSETKFEHHWEFEERAVTFCCECGADA